MGTSKKDAARAANVLRSGKGGKSVAASDLAQAASKRGRRRVANAAKSGRFQVVRRPEVRSMPRTVRPQEPNNPPGGKVDAGDERPLPESVDEEIIARLIAEAEDGIPAEKLRRRGRPAIGGEAARAFSIRLPDDLITLADERSRIDSVSRGETIRRALIEYLAK